MPTVGMVVNRSARVVWGFFTEPKNWERWWGGALERASPGWQEGGRLIWSNGNTTHISALSQERLVELTAPYMQHTFRFTSQGDRTTRVEITFGPRGGAAFSDGGRAHGETLASGLQTFKQLVESETVESVPAESPPVQRKPPEPESRPVEGKPLQPRKTAKPEPKPKKKWWQIWK